MSYSIAPDRTEHTVYAGFWWRALAFILDWIVLTVIDGIVAFAAGMEAWMHDAFAMRPTIGLYTFVIGLLYFPLLESSRLRATLGKLACGLVVVDEDGRQLSFSRAFGRTLGKAVSGRHPDDRLHDGRLDPPQAGPARHDGGLPGAEENQRRHFSAAARARLAPLRRTTSSPSAATTAPSLALRIANARSSPPTAWTGSV